MLNNPLLQKDIWHTIDDLNLKINQHNKLITINFQVIKQDWLKLLAKLYILVRSKRQISVGHLKKEVYHLGRFSQFIEQKFIFSSDQINNQLFEEFGYYLKSLNLHPNTIASYFIILKSFFNLCREEEWLNVNNYCFKDRIKISTPTNNEIEYIPEEVWQKLTEHLHYLPEQLQRMVIIIRTTGLRIGELLNLPLDCLRQRGKQWRLRFLTEKYQVVDELPICEELVVIIKEQQKYIRQLFKDYYENLFHSNKGGPTHSIPVPKIMCIGTFNKRLNKLAQEHSICTNEGKIWHFRSHQFRKTVATVMTNAGVRDLIIQKYLRHRSPDMQNYYKHLLKVVLGEEYQELMKGTNYVNSTGEIVANHQPQNPITELVRRKMYAITTQYGECHRPILKSPCQTVNACYSCEHWLTSTEDLSNLKNDLQLVKTELDIVSELGMVRQKQGLTIDQHNLVIRLEKLEKFSEGN